MAALPSFLSWSSAHRHLHSFPTRRSSDLASRRFQRVSVSTRRTSSRSAASAAAAPTFLRETSGEIALGAGADGTRSEEHTSELQSHHDLVCRLLLEKKNTRKRQ